MQVLKYKDWNLQVILSDNSVKSGYNTFFPLHLAFPYSEYSDTKMVCPVGKAELDLMED